MKLQSCVPSLSRVGAEFHVVKNSIFSVAAAAKEQCQTFLSTLKVQTAIVVGGAIPPVSPRRSQVFKKKEKVDLKGGILNERELTRDEIIALSKLARYRVASSTTSGTALAACHRIRSCYQCSAAKRRQCATSKSTRSRRRSNP